MGVLDREYMKPENDRRKLPRLVILPEKPTPSTWVKRLIYTLCGLILLMVVFGLLR